jgi:alkanesulfonate monooxygenase SsuD/methylene tetrahydromethanopterin reductase-like flavin-dependent oxidoreductase (luciferase family)
MLEAYTLLGAVAARTSVIRLGVLVIGVIYRNPPFLAKVVTTLDIVSSGRAILGIGAAWNDEEARAYGYDWPRPRNGSSASRTRSRSAARCSPTPSRP